MTFSSCFLSIWRIFLLVHQSYRYCQDFISNKDVDCWTFKFIRFIILHLFLHVYIQSGSCFSLQIKYYIYISKWMITICLHVYTCILVWTNVICLEYEKTICRDALQSHFYQYSIRCLNFCGNYIHAPPNAYVLGIICS